MIGQILGNPMLRQTVRDYGAKSSAAAKSKAAQDQVNAAIAALQGMLQQPLPASPTMPTSPMASKEALTAGGIAALARLLGARGQYVQGALNSYVGGKEAQAQREYQNAMQVRQDELQKRQQALQAAQLGLGNLQDLANIARTDATNASNLARANFIDQANRADEKARYQQQLQMRQDEETRARRDAAYRQEVGNIDAIIAQVHGLGGTGALSPAELARVKQVLADHIRLLNQMYPEYPPYNPTLVEGTTPSYQGLQLRAGDIAHDNALNDARYGGGGGLSGSFSGPLAPMRPDTGSIPGFQPAIDSKTMATLQKERQAKVMELRGIEGQIHYYQANPLPKPEDQAKMLNGLRAKQAALNAIIAQYDRQMKPPTKPGAKPAAGPPKPGTTGSTGTRSTQDMLRDAGLIK